MFAETEAKIVARLKAKVPAGTHVDVLDELIKVKELRQKAPAVWVIYDGYSIGNRIASAPGIVQITQEWFAVVATKSARGQGKIDDAKLATSALARIVIEALAGYHLGDGKYLQVEGAPGPEYDAGYCHLPLAFSNAATFKGTP